MIHGVIAAQRLLTGGGGGGGDPYWSSVASLVHFDGADGGTTIVDEKAGVTWLAEGNAQLDTAQAMFGDASALFDGSGDRLKGTAADFAVGTGDFTLEFFARPSESLSSGTKYLFSQEYIAAAYFAISYDYGAGKFASLGGLPSISGAHAKGAWHHVAIVRSAGTIKVYIDGVMSGSLANTQNYSSNILYVGGTSTSIAGSGSWFAGHVDEFRVTKGIARYTADFTPPPAPFPNS